MALMYDNLNGDETPGEKGLYYKLKNNLSDEFLVWHNKKLHSQSVEIDFIIFHPNYGIWFLEVKDWNISQIISVDNSTWTIKIGADCLNKKNPLDQAMKAAILTKEAFKENAPNLFNKVGKHKGKLKFPYYYGAVFYNITASEIENSAFKICFPLKKILTKDFIQGERTTSEDWERKFILDLRDERVRFDCKLSLEEIDSVKRILGVPVVKDIQNGEVAGTLDEKQENLTTLNIEKHMVIEGPAGSGKSIVLLNRALKIKQKYPSWQVGIFCFNAVMANYLRTMFATINNRKDEIDIYDVWDWLKKYLPEACQNREEEDLNERILKALKDSNYSVSKQYDALLIDEGQDASEAHLTLYRAMLNKSTNSFTFFYDKRQSLYGKGELVDKLAEFGFSIDDEKPLVRQKRSVLVELAMKYYDAYYRAEKPLPEIVLENKKLRKKYFFEWVPKGVQKAVSNVVTKTAAAIVTLAKVTGVSRLFQTKKGSDEQLQELEAVLLRSVEFTQSKTIPEMITRMADDIVMVKNKDNVRFADWLVIFPAYTINKEEVVGNIQKVFQEKGIPYLYIHKSKGFSFGKIDGEKDLKEKGDNRRNAELNYDGVKIMTINSAKGLDSKRVAVLAFDKIGQNPERKNPAEMGYVAITRAKEKCLIYYIENSDTVKTLNDVFNEMTKGSSPSNRQQWN